MIRLLFTLLHWLGGVVVKILILIAATNLLYDYLNGYPLAWDGALETDALGDRFVWNIQTVVPLVEVWIHEAVEISEPIVRNAMAFLKGIVTTVQETRT